MAVMETFIAKFGDDILLIDGFDSALLGICSRIGQPDVALYDYYKCLDILMERDGMEDDEAEEHMQYNVIGSHVGSRTPAFLYRPE